jgi:hypothetical protein
MAEDPAKRESMREAIEGFERDRVAAREKGLQFPHYSVPFGYFTRADVMDLFSAFQEQRQLAIHAPNLAESAEALAKRLKNLAERISLLVPEREESNG